MTDSRRIEELKRRVKLDPASIAFAALAEEYRKAGRFEEAIQTCRAGLKRHPVYVSARVTLGRSLLEVGRYDEARAELEQVLRVAPENLTAIRTLAELHKRLGDLPEPAPTPSTGAPAATPSRPVRGQQPQAVAREPVPIRPVRLSAVARVQDRPAPDEQASARPVAASGFQAARSSPARPKDRTLAGLESFLGAIRRARAAMGPNGSTGP